MSPLAILNDEGVKTWGAIFKDGYTPIRSALPGNATLTDVKPGDGPAEQKIYLLDEKRLTPEQMQAVTDRLANRFFAPPKDIREAITEGMPIRESLTRGVIIEASDEPELLEDEVDLDEDADDYDEAEEEEEG